MAKKLAHQYILENYQGFKPVEGEVYHEGKVIGIQRNGKCVVEIDGLDDPVINVISAARVGQSILMSWQQKWLATKDDNVPDNLTDARVYFPETREVSNPTPQHRREIGAIKVKYQG